MASPTASDLTTPIMTLRWITLALLGSVGIVALDALMARTARARAINYGSFAPVSFIAYLAFGALAGRYTSVALATAAALPMAIADATLGWHVAIRAGVVPAEALDRPPRIKFALALAIVFGMTSLAFLGAYLVDVAIR